MKETLRTVLRIEKDSQGMAKVVWIDNAGAQFPPYRLYVDHVHETATDARSVLADMYNEFLKPTPDFSGPVRMLAEKGKAMRDAIFFAGPPEDSAQARESREWFESLSIHDGSQVELTIHVDPVLQIPWGLLHDLGASSTSTSDIYSGFCSLRYSVAALYNGMRPTLLKSPRARDRIRILSALDEEVFRSVLDKIGVEDRELIETITRFPVGRALTIKGVLQRWRDVGNNSCVLNFFGHAAEHEIRLRQDECLSARKFRELFRRESVSSQPYSDPVFVLTFLNGCSTGAGVGPDSFLIATADPGFCGFVGVEAPVPDQFAMLFGAEFLHSILVRGHSVRQSMQALWRKHEPMAIFYGCHAHPDFRVETGPSVPVPAGFADRNLSTARMVSDAL